jgi:hypothetical protein
MNVEAMRTVGDAGKSFAITRAAKSRRLTRRLCHPSRRRLRCIPAEHISMELVFIATGVTGEAQMMTRVAKKHDIMTQQATIQRNGRDLPSEYRSNSHGLCGVDSPEHEEIVSLSDDSKNHHCRSFVTPA